jgi:hypothetical protein
MAVGIWVLQYFKGQCGIDRLNNLAFYNSQINLQKNDRVSNHFATVLAGPR